jgi:hypothetical protein
VNVKGFWTAIGAALALVALYLVLVNWGGAQGVLSTLFSGLSGTFKTLQGR